MSNKIKDHMMQIIIALIGAVAVIAAAIITPLVSNYLKSDSYQNQTQKPPKMNPEKPEKRQAKAQVITEDENHVSDPNSANPEVSINSVISNQEVFSVFEGQEFDLCGYRDFTATVYHMDNKRPEIKIRSMDRNIPGRKFRGFEQIVPIEEVIELWPNCSVEFNYEQTKSTVRILIAYRRR